MRVGSVAPQRVAAIGCCLGKILGCRIEICGEGLDPAFAFDAARGQYNSTEILKRLEAFCPNRADRILGIAEVDLFIPILTFVFGEALLNRPSAVISLYRLRPRFYGLPENPDLVLRRARTEAAHELGHTLGLIHCPDYACAMHASRVADEIDLKGPGFCADCAADLTQKKLRPQTYR